MANKADPESDNWEKLSACQDGLALIRVLHQFAHEKDGVTAGMQEIVDADCALYGCKQGKSSETEYLREFKARVDNINESGGRAGWSPAAANLVAKELGLDYDTAGADKKADIMSAARKRYLACLWVRNLDQRRHYKMKEDIRDDYVRGRRDTMPQDLVDAMRVVSGYATRRARDRGRRTPVDPNTPGVAMATTDDTGGRSRGGGAGRGRG